MRQTKKLLVFILLVSMLLSSINLTSTVNAQAQSGLETFAYRVFELNKIDEKNEKLENTEFEIYNENGNKLKFRTMNNTFLKIVGKDLSKFYGEFPSKVEYHSLFPLNGVLVHGNNFDPNSDETLNDSISNMSNESSESGKSVSGKNKVVVGLLPTKLSEIRYNIDI